ncbi:MAG: hypothetical protein WBK91_05995 [Alphaproteobacteria bacterium]
MTKKHQEGNFCKAVCDMPRLRSKLHECKELQLSERTIRELELSTQEAIKIYFAKPTKHLRPSHVARKISAMANSLKKVAGIMEEVGEHGMMFLWAASNVNREVDSMDWKCHYAYLHRMARWAESAAITSKEHSASQEDHKGGRTPDENLNSLIVILMSRFHEVLSLRPTHTVAPETGLGTSIFDMYVKEAFECFAPDAVPESRCIDEAIVRALPSRDSKLFTPPPFPDE